MTEFDTLAGGRCAFSLWASRGSALTYGAGGVCPTIGPSLRKELFNQRTGWRLWKRPGGRIGSRNRSAQQMNPDGSRYPECSITATGMKTANPCRLTLKVIQYDTYGGFTPACGR